MDEEPATLFHVLPNCTFSQNQESVDSVTVCGSLFGLTSTEVFISNQLDAFQQKPERPFSIHVRRARLSE